MTPYPLRPNDRSRETARCGRTHWGVWPAMALVGCLSVMSNAAAAQDFRTVPSKVTRYAERLLSRYDKLPTGQLEREEWHGKMSGKPQAIDIDGDGIITLDELTRHIVRYARSHPFMLPLSSAEAESDQTSTFTPVTQTPTGEQQATASQTVPTPDQVTTPANGLTAPGWYLEMDTDGDGQVTLQEFAPDLSTARLAEFGKQDLNGDGVLNLAETVAPPQ